MAHSSNHLATVVSIKSIIAVMYSEQNKMATSLRLIKEVLDVEKVLELDSRISQMAYRFAGQIYYKIDTELSIKYFKKCLSICEKLESNLELEFCYAYLAIIYEQDKNYSEALFYQKKLEVLKADMYKEQLDLEVEELQTKFETEQKEQEIKTLEKEQAYQKLEVEKQGVQLKQQQQNLLSVILGFALLISISILLFNRYRLKQKNEKLVLQTEQFGLEKQQKKTKQQLKIAEMRTDFFTNVSHEFRTPLTLIIGPLEDLLKKEKISYRSSIEGIHKNANSLLTLVNETLDLSKVEHGHLPLVLKRLKLNDFILKIGQTFAPLSETQNNKLKISDHSKNCLVDFDTRKLEKVFVNLLGNAFKHSTSGCDILISINQPDKDLISIQVKDNGIGIDSEHLPYVFNRFYQVNQKSKGSGVGLALTKQLVELHDGTITVTSQKDIGSVFTVTLPMIQHAVNEVKITKTENSNKIDNQNEITQSKTILIVEDHDEVREYLKSLFLENYQVITANDGQEGVTLAEQKNPDLIVCDIMMPYQSGLELTKHLKQNLSTSHIPIILLTAKASLENKIEGLDIGADDYLSKPFHSDELLKRCANLIKSRTKLRELFSTNYFISPTKLSNNEVDQSFLKNAINIVESNLTHADFNVKIFCQQLAYNRSGVHNKLKALTGKNTTQFIKSIRLRHAAKLIRETSNNMTDISNMIGFGSRQAFNKAFKEQFKLTPSEFKTKDSGFI
jgi:signal transduction histidine kinase/DNA-binding response OmpR family regulator